MEEFIGNSSEILQLRRWIENIKLKRVCFITGATGCGKSELARLLLKEYGYSIKEFEGLELRNKPVREQLYQTLRFNDVLALIKNQKSFKKAVIIDDFENMYLATQEVYKNIREMIKNKQTHHIPIIFTGTKPLKGKKPLSSQSIFINLRSRTKEEILQILNIFLQKNNISLDDIKKLDLVNHCGGDIRRLHNFVTNQYISHHEESGPLNILQRIININEDRNLNTILSDINTEGMTIPHGIHWCYIDYVPWYVNKNYKKGQKTVSYLEKEISHLISDYAILLDKERSTCFWELKEFADAIISFGFRTKLKNISHIPSRDIVYKGQTYWWEHLGKKNGRQGLDSVETPCINKTLRASLINYQIQNLSFQMVSQKVEDDRCWRPNNCRRMMEILRNSDIKIKNKERLVKLINLEKEN